MAAAPAGMVRRSGRIVTPLPELSSAQHLLGEAFGAGLATYGRHCRLRLLRDRSTNQLTFVEQLPFADHIWASPTGADAGDTRRLYPPSATRTPAELSAVVHQRDRAFLTLLQYRQQADR